jgi:putative DNA primase/helicase
MPDAHDDLIVFWAEAKGRSFASARNTSGSWAFLRKKLSRPTRTRERYAAYRKMSRDDQLGLKSIDGWISGAQCEGKWRNLRNVKPRNLMTLDLDYPGLDFWDLYRLGAHWISEFESFGLTTRSYSPEAPRFRLLLPMTRMVSREEYGPLVRIVAMRMDGGPEMTTVDVVSSRPAQMMFLPTASADGQFLFHHSEGRVLDPDEQFDWFTANHGDWKNLELLPKFKGEEKLRKRADKAEDPWLKPGMIGHFCRAYPIGDAIAEFLPDIYQPGQSDPGGKPRYTYTGGSASNGAVVEDDGRFLYSWHGTDPVGEQLVNAWDLVRIHMFGDLDSEKPDDLPIGERPSTKKMQEWVKEQPRYREEVVKSKYDLMAMFDDSDLASEPEPDPPEELALDILELLGDGEPESDPIAALAAISPSPKKRLRNPDKNWMREELEYDQNGNIKSNIHNIGAILYNDPRVYGSIRYDEFSRTTRLFYDIISKTPNVPNFRVTDHIHGDRWQEIMRATLRAILAAPAGAGKVGYGLGTVAERDITDGVLLAATRNKYHPIKQFLEAEPWDGVERMDRLFIDYLGCPDTPYHHETARAVLLASVARVYEPGHKFDFAPVLQGPQGIRKSSFIETLYDERYFDEITCKLSETQKIAEQITGCWGMEFGELSAFHKSDHNEAKQFMSKREDTVRMAYAHDVTEFPRQTVFWGSTNDATYLKDPTGNRRWWPILVLFSAIDTDRLNRERQQIWAEAKAVYDALRAEYPKAVRYDLDLSLQSDEAKAEAVALQERARNPEMYEEWASNIEEWADQPILLSTLIRQYNPLGESLRIKGPHGEDPQSLWVQRVVFRPLDAHRFALNLGDTIVDHLKNTGLRRALQHLKGWSPQPSTAKRRYLGSTPVNSWQVRDDATDEEIALGYRITYAPDFTIADLFTDADIGENPAAL